MRNNLDASLILVWQFFGIMFCALCVLLILGLPIAAIGYVFVVGIESGTYRIPILLPLVSIAISGVLIKILALSISTFRNFSWQSIKLISALSTLVFGAITMTYLMLR